jgi:iron complex transport system permease protein
MRSVLLLSLLALGLVASVVVSLGAGAVRLSPSQVAAALLGHESGGAGAVVREIRLPRTGMALLAGAALSAAGGVFQALLRNPLADPFLLGVSSGSALGAVLGMTLSAAVGRPLPRVLAALLGGLVSLSLVYLLARRDGRLHPTSLILSGVIVSSFCSSVLLFLSVMAEARQLQGAVFWLMGGLSGAAAGGVLPMAAAVVPVLAILFLRSARLNLLTQGEDAAASMGLDVLRERRILFFLGCMATGVTVAFTGLIGFVGLVVPHAARLLGGPDHRVLLPASILLGASFLILSDTTARTILAPAELPVGALTAFVGAPFFLLLQRRHGHGWIEP